MDKAKVTADRIIHFMAESAGVPQAVPTDMVQRLEQEIADWPVLTKGQCFEVAHNDDPANWPLDLPNALAVSAVLDDIADTMMWPM